MGGHTDTGRKVYVLAPNAALVFAGDVETAQRAISDLERLAQRMRGRGRMDPIQHVPDVLRRAHTKAKERAQRRRQPTPRLLVLVGVRGDLRASSIIKYASDSDFLPLIIPGGVNAIGHPRDVNAFNLMFRENEAHQSDQQDTRLQ